jgi:hypothetical protein
MAHAGDDKEPGSGHGISCGLASATGVSLSASPWMIRLGILTLAGPGRRSGPLREATNCRAIPSGHAFEIGTHLRLIDTINGEIAGLDEGIQQQLASLPGLAPAAG